MSSPQFPQLKTIQEAARDLRISRSFLYKLIEAREIEYYRVGRRILFSPEQLDRYLESRLTRAE